MLEIIQNKPTEEQREVTGRNRIKKGSRVGIVCCSDGQRDSTRSHSGIALLEKTLEHMGLVPVFSRFIYQKQSVFSGTDRERARALMDFYQDDSIKVIFDISGGDLANGLLPYLDFEVIGKSRKQFWGYSDLTTILNAIYARTGNSSVLYQVRNLVYEHGDTQRKDFCDSVLGEGNRLFSLHTEFIQGERLKGIVVGGNIRCLLKLAGTRYLPELHDKILLLEGYSGTVAKINTYLCQLEQIGAFEQIGGILLGTFTEMERTECRPTVTELVKQFVGEKLPIVKSSDIGHGTDSKAIVIGKEMELSRKSVAWGIR